MTPTQAWSRALWWRIAAVTVGLAHFALFAVGLDVVAVFASWVFAACAYRTAKIGGWARGWYGYPLDDDHLRTADDQ